jgi:hypothetical protein
MHECFFQLGNFVLEKIIEAKWLSLKWFLFNLSLKKLCLELTQSYTEDIEIVLIVIIMIMLGMCSVHKYTHKKERIIVLKN